MPLPILQANREPTADDLVRLFHRTELHWTRHLGEEAALEVGTAFTNPQLRDVHDANRMLDAAIPDGASAEAAAEEAQRHFAGLGTRCWKWAINPAAAEKADPLRQQLVSSGHRMTAAEILHLEGAPAVTVREVAGLTIIPERASYRHARQLAQEGADECGHGPQMVEAHLLHLDDPHWDALLALNDGRAVGSVGVLASGDIGRIDELFVSREFRGRGIGRTLMSRALEICARSLFKHVLLSVVKENRAAQELCRSLGFRRIGEFVEYRAAEA